MPRPNTVLTTYRVRAEAEREFQTHLIAHWPALRRLGLVFEEYEPTYFYGRDEDDLPFFIEIFCWASNDAQDAARTHDEVRLIEDGMAALCEERAGRPAVESVPALPLDLSGAWDEE